MHNLSKNDISKELHVLPLCARSEQMYLGRWWCLLLVVLLYLGQEPWCLLLVLLLYLEQEPWCLLLVVVLYLGQELWCLALVVQRLGTDK